MLVHQDRSLAEEDMHDFLEDMREERSLVVAHMTVAVAVAVDMEEAADMLAAKACHREICFDFARLEQPTTLYLLVP